MKTKMFITTMLVIAIHAMVMSQERESSRQQILVTRVSKATAAKPSSQTTSRAISDKKEKEMIMALTERIKEYGKQMEELKELKEKLNEDINGFFNLSKANNISIDISKVVKGFESEMKQALKVYGNNSLEIKNLLIYTEKTDVSDNMVDLMALAGKYANTAEWMQEEAYNEPGYFAKAGMLSNSIEKMQFAINCQEKVINILDRPASPVVVCYDSK